LADFPVNRVAELTPSAWARHNQASHNVIGCLSLLDVLMLDAD
jgi:hypothetical protein